MLNSSDLSIRRLVLVPALIALAVTILRLLGELMGGSSILFNREAGGGGALVGIVWLVPVFGVYFGIRLVRSGLGPERAGRVIGFAALGLVAGMAIIAATVALTGDPNVSVSLRGAVLQQVGMAIASLVAVLILRSAWPVFWQTMLSYAYASRIPVVLVMLLAMLGDWGTHYELGPPGYPEMGLLTKFVLIGVFPQMTVWVMFTMVLGTLFGGIAAALLPTRTEQEGGAR